MSPVLWSFVMLWSVLFLLTSFHVLAGDGAHHDEMQWLIGNVTMKKHLERWQVLDTFEIPMSPYRQGY